MSLVLGGAAAAALPDGKLQSWTALAASLRGQKVRLFGMRGTGAGRTSGMIAGAAGSFVPQMISPGAGLGVSPGVGMEGVLGVGAGGSSGPGGFGGPGLGIGAGSGSGTCKVLNKWLH